MIPREDVNSDFGVSLLTSPLFDNLDPYPKEARRLEEGEGGVIEDPDRMRGAGEGEMVEEDARRGSSLT